jgi:hypothetical protein
MKVIGITGVKGSGKDTAYQLLKRTYPEIKQVSLAGKLKEVCLEIFELSEFELTDRKAKEAYFDVPRVLTEETLLKIYKQFNEARNVNYDKHIRPHIGYVLESPRRILQYVGTEVLRSIRDNIHSFYLYAQIKDTEGVYFITDVRFVDEYEFFKNIEDINFEAWYINNKKAEVAGSGDIHPSEMGIFEIRKDAFHIDNNGTLNDFEKTLLGAFNGRN